MHGDRVHRIDTPERPSHYRAFRESAGGLVCVERWSRLAWSIMPASERPPYAFRTRQGWIALALVEPLSMPREQEGICLLPAEASRPSVALTRPRPR